MSKRIISIVLVLAMLVSLGSYSTTASASQKTGENPASESPVTDPEIYSSINEELLADGDFYLSASQIKMSEAGEGAVLTIYRNGSSDADTSVKLTLVDYTASYDTNYKIEVSGTDPVSPEDTTSILDYLTENADSIEEYNYADSILDGTAEEEAEETELTEETREQTVKEALEVLGEIQESSGTSEEISEEISEETEESAVTEVSSDLTSLKQAKEAATGLTDDKTAMTGTGNTISLNDTSLAYMTEGIDAISTELSSVYIMVEFKAGQTRADVKITPVDDSAGEGDRYFIAKLSAAGNESVNSAYSSCTVYLLDDEECSDAVISFAAKTFTTNADENFLTVELTRSGNMLDTVAVMLDTSDDTALQDRDYSQVHAQVVFPFGITRRTINIPVSSEYVTGIATFTLTLSEPVGCVIDGETATGRITNLAGIFTTASGLNDVALGDAIDITDKSVVSRYGSSKSSDVSYNTSDGKLISIHRGDDGTTSVTLEDNIISLSMGKYGSSLTVNGKIFYNDTAVGENESTITLLPATGAMVRFTESVFGTADDEGVISMSGQLPAPASGSVYVKFQLIANSAVTYKEIKVGSSDTSIELGTMSVSPFSSEVPYVSTVTVTNSRNVLLDTIPIEDNAITRISATINNNYSSYVDGAGVTRKEHVTKVEFLVYDAETLTEKFVLTTTMGGQEVTSLTTDGETYYIDYNFSKGQRSQFDSSDLLYVRITTNRYVGSGIAYDYDGNPISSDIMKQTVYAPVRSGYIFAETTRTAETYYDLDIIEESGMFKLPLIGSMYCSFGFKNFRMTLMPIANGYRVAFGVVPAGWYDGQHHNLNGGFNSDTGEAYGISDLSSIFNDMSQVVSPGNQQGTGGGIGMKKWYVTPFVGIYLDFGLAYSTSGGITSTTFKFMGGGGYLGVSGYFRYTYYWIIYGIPVYAGFDVSLTLACMIGAALKPNADGTYTDFLDNGLSDYDFDFLFLAQLYVSCYVGVGVCQTLGVRGGFQLAISFIANPTITSRYPDVSTTGWQVTGSIKIWVDALLFSVPIPVYNFDKYNYGYFEDIEEINSDNKSVTELLAGVNSGEESLKLTEKSRKEEESEWVAPATEPILLGSSGIDSISQDTLMTNAYDDPQYQLMAYDSDNDGEEDKIILIFLDDDLTREAAERTVLKYSIYDIGSRTWTSPEVISNTGRADSDPDVCITSDGILVAWTSRDADADISTNSGRFSGMDVFAAFINKSTGAVESVTQLTDDNYYDCEPVIVTDDSTGDILVHYMKASVNSSITTGNDALAQANLMYNEAEPMYMLYSGSEHRWVTDKFYANECASGADEASLLAAWKGQRFLSSPIADAGQNSPVITDFEATTMELGTYPTAAELRSDSYIQSILTQNQLLALGGEGAFDMIDEATMELVYARAEELYQASIKNYGVYAYSVDFDNNTDTEEDRELYIQLYDFETHETSEPVRVTDNAVSDASPKFAGNYLFWSSDTDEQLYVNLQEEYAASPASGENWEVSTVEIAHYEDSDTVPEFADYTVYQGDDDRIYLVWQAADSDGCQDLYVSVLSTNEAYHNCWSVANRFTETASWDTLPAIAAIDGGVLMVNNQYSMNLEDDSYEVSDVDMIATTLKIYDAVDIEMSTEDNKTLNVTISDTGLRDIGKIKVTGRLMLDGSQAGEDHIFWLTRDASGISIYIDEAYEEEVELPELDESRIGEYTYEITCKIGSGSPEVFTYNFEKVKAHYTFEDTTVKQTDEGFLLTATVNNTSKVASDGADRLMVKFNDLYLSGAGSETFGEINIEEALGRKLAAGESATVTIPLEISSEKLESGYVNAFITACSEDGTSISDNESLTIRLERPYNIQLSEAENGRIVIEDETV